MTMASIPKSEGHLFFLSEADAEYFKRGEDILRAPIGNVVMPDGYRVGRFECPCHMERQLRAILSIPEES